MADTGGVNLGKTLGRLATAHPGVSFAVHARSGMAPQPQTEGFDPSGPARLPGLAILHVGTPGQEFGGRPSAGPRAPKGPQGALPAPNPTTSEKTLRGSKADKPPKALRGEQFD